MFRQSKAFKLFAFDVDGVLLESDEAHYLSFKDALYDLLGFKYTREDNEPIKAMSTKQKIKWLEENGILEPLTAEEFKAVSSLKFHYLFYYMHMMKLNPEVKSMFEFAKDNGIKVCLVSNARCEFSRLVINTFDCENLVDFYFGNDMGLGSKPLPDMYLAAMDACGATPDQTVIFEDSEVGLTAALASGANVYKVDSYMHVTKQLLVDIVNASVSFCQRN